MLSHSHYNKEINIFQENIKIGVTNSHTRVIILHIRSQCDVKTLQYINIKECKIMLRVVKLGTVAYNEATVIQKKIQKQRIEGQCVDTLLLLEHPSVITMGIRASEENLKVSKETLSEIGIDVIDSNRGGDVTYHGPGQIVGYVIMDLEARGRDIRRFVSNMEEVFINIMMEDYGISAYTGKDKYTGVFVGDRKLTAVGIAVNHKVTMHGFAFNVNTNLEHFDWIVPCGLHDRGVTSVKAITEQHIDMDTMMDKVAMQYEKVYDTDITFLSKEALYKEIGYQEERMVGVEVI